MVFNRKDYGLPTIHDKVYKFLAKVKKIKISDFDDIYVCGAKKDRGKGIFLSNNLVEKIPMTIDLFLGMGTVLKSSNFGRLGSDGYTIAFSDELRRKDKILCARFLVMALYEFNGWIEENKKEV